MKKFFLVILTIFVAKSYVAQANEEQDSPAQPQGPRVPVEQIDGIVRNLGQLFADQD